MSMGAYEFRPTIPKLIVVRKKRAAEYLSLIIMELLLLVPERWTVRDCKDHKTVQSPQPHSNPKRARALPSQNVIPSPEQSSSPARGVVSTSPRSLPFSHIQGVINVVILQTRKVRQHFLDRVTFWRKVGSASLARGRTVNTHLHDFFCRGCCGRRLRCWSTEDCVRGRSS
jgi:hypothetical protein